MSTATGSVTNVTSGTGLVAGTITATGTINIDVGSTAGKIVQLNASGQIPVIDGSLLTNINAVTLQTYPLAGTAPAPNQVLKWNGSQWEPSADTDAGGTVTAVVSGSGLVAGTITIAVDIGTAASKVVQFDTLRLVTLAMMVR